MAEAQPPLPFSNPPKPFTVSDLRVYSCCPPSAKTLPFTAISDAIRRGHGLLQAAGQSTGSGIAVGLEEPGKRTAVDSVRGLHRVGGGERSVPEFAGQLSGGPAGGRA